MRVLERRLRRLEVGLLPPPETADVYSDVACRAAKLGLPEPEDDPEPIYRPGMSIGETIRASVQRMRERRAAEEA